MPDFLIIFCFLLGYVTIGLFINALAYERPRIEVVIGWPYLVIILLTIFVIQAIWYTSIWLVSLVLQYIDYIRSCAEESKDGE